MNNYYLSGESVDLKLRYIDWRFLLSNPKPKKSIVYGKSRINDSLGIVSEIVVDILDTYNETNFDLAAAADPSTETIRKFHSLLGPLGYCCIEWNVSRFSNLKSIEKKLKDLGFEDIVFYIHDSVDHDFKTISWIPLFVPSVFNYLFIPEFLQQTAISNLLSKLRYSILWLNSKYIPSYPLLFYPDLMKFSVKTIACKNPTHRIFSNIKTKDSQESKSIPINVIDSCIKSLGMNLAAKNTVTHMYSLGNDDSYEIILLVFAEAERIPLFLVKTYRTEEYNYELENELKTLIFLQKYHPDIKKIPRILSSDYNSGILSIGETFLKGPKISEIIKCRNYEDIADFVTRWLINLAVETQTPNNYDKDIRRSIISDIITPLESVIDSKILVKTKEIIVNMEVPCLVCQHGDFWPGNVILAPDGELGVFDWGSSVISGLPAVDIIFFLYTSTYELKKGSYIECWKEILDENTFVGSVFKKCLLSYTEAIGIDHFSLPAFRLMTWVNATFWVYKDQLYDKTPTQPKKNYIINHPWLSLWKKELSLTVFLCFLNFPF